MAVSKFHSHAEELGAISGVVERFKQDVLRPAVARSEHVISQEALQKVVRQAREIGLLPGETDEAERGSGLWENPCDSLGVLSSTEMVRALAEANCGVAFHLHSLALGAFLKRRLGLRIATTSIPLLQGGNGLARGALARLLLDLPLAPNAELLLKEYFPGGNDGRLFLLQAGDLWEELVTPWISAGAASLTWRVYRRDQLSVRPVSSNHGLDELLMFEVEFPRDQAPAETAGVSFCEAKKILICALGIQALAMIALGVGSVNTAFRMARDYALERTQGGQRIAEHAAVQVMLGNIASVVGVARGWLLHERTLAETPQELAEIFQARAAIHPLLCAAANDALQIFGGYGYMKDCGLEKIVRDNNQLKVSFGTPSELKLFLAVLETASC